MIGDAHIALGYPNKSDKWIKVHREYFYDFLIPLLKREAQPGDIVIQMGDLFDNRDFIPIEHMNLALDVVEEISKILPMHIIVGNHDLWTRSTSSINAIRPFRFMPNVHVYDTCTKIEFCGKNLLMMPYVNNKREQIKQIQENRDCHYLFCHSDLNGAKMHLTSVGHRNMDKIDVEEFSNFIKVYSGHYHIVQEDDNFTFVGNIFQMDRNDYNNQKGIFRLNVDTNEEYFYPNNVSPVFKKVIVKTVDDLQNLETLDTSKDFVDLVIANSIIVGDRKNRRLLEKITHFQTFEKVEYINDIVSEVELTEEQIVDINESVDEAININLDYEESIKNYILLQRYDTDEAKEKILDIYEEIINTYRGQKNQD